MAVETLGTAEVKLAGGHWQAVSAQRLSRAWPHTQDREKCQWLPKASSGRCKACRHSHKDAKVIAIEKAGTTLVQTEKSNINYMEICRTMGAER